MTDCLRCHLPLDDRDDERGALVHVVCPEPALDEAAVLLAEERRRLDDEMILREAIAREET